MPEPDAAADRALLAAAVREAGAIALSYFGRKPRAWDKSKGNPVSEADLAVDGFLRDTLTAARPGYGWLSEESADAPEDRRQTRTLVIDPIDGTIAFLKHKPEFVVAAAVVEAGRPIAAALFNPVTGELYEASAGGGASCNGARLQVSARTALEGARVLAGKALFAHPGWPAPWPAMHVETRGSIALRLALVAAGAFDAMLALSAKHDWDLAAGDLLVTEAGGRVTAHDGRILLYNGAQPLQPSVLAATPGVYPAFHARLKDLTLPAQGPPS